MSILALVGTSVILLISNVVRSAPFYIYNGQAPVSSCRTEPATNISDRFCYVVSNYHMLNATEGQLFKLHFRLNIFTIYEANTCVEPCTYL
jgi:hypothetical protein